MQIPVRASYAEIDLAAFRWNFKKIQNHVKPAAIGAVVKANAYGHGIEEIAREAVKLGVHCLCVGFVQTGLKLREIGLDVPVLVLIPASYNEIEQAIHENLELSAYSLEDAQKVSAAAKRLTKKAVIHVFIDTGMHRAGLLWEQAVEEIKKIYELPGIRIKGIYTHFASADWSDLTFTYKQLDRFKSVLSGLPFTVPVIHAANSAAILQVKESLFNMVRPGLSLYGYYPSMQCKRPFLLRPVMSLKSYVADVQTYKANESIGYSLTYTIPEQTNIAAVPIGYGDGVNRLFSNNGSVLIRGKRYPIIGRVSLDWILADVGGETDIKPGDEVVLMGKQGNSKITIYEWCETLQTIPYEVTCNISSRVPRKFINASE